MTEEQLAFYRRLAEAGANAGLKTTFDDLVIDAFVGVLKGVQRTTEPCRTPWYVWLTLLVAIYGAVVNTLLLIERYSKRKDSKSASH
jgi:hypothetical protein